MLTFLLGVAMALGPPALWLWAASRPGMSGLLPPVILAGLALPFLLAAFRPEGRLGRAARSARWVCLLLMSGNAILLPKLAWAFRMNHCGLRELSDARARVERFRAAHGRAPATLEELGPLPRLRIWTFSEREENHVHPATSRVSIVRRDAPPSDDGAWGYDPAKGRVFISCAGVEPKLRRVPLHDL